MTPCVSLAVPLYVPQYVSLSLRTCILQQHGYAVRALKHHCQL